MHVKVCGMTQPEQVARLVEMGVDYAGFIFYPDSPRYVLLTMTREELLAVKGIKKVGVFVNANIEEVLGLVQECRLDLVQLHGEESPAYCAQVKERVAVIKAFRIGEQDRPEQLVGPYADGCDYFLFDTRGAAYGGTGQKFEWSRLNALKAGRPFFLSGGIAPNDASQIRAFQQGYEGPGLFAVDINSRFETAPGVKDLSRVEAFFRELNVE